MDSQFCSRLFRNTIFVAGILFQSTINANQVELSDTNLSVSIPPGLELVDFVYTQTPSLNFYPPKNADGGRPGPNFQIIQYHGSNVEAHIEHIRANSHSSIVMKPTKRTIAGKEAIEIGYSGEIIVDFVGGGAATGTSYSHEFLFEENSFLYVCSVDEIPTKDEKNIEILRKLCESIRFDKEKAPNKKRNEMDGSKEPPIR